MLKMTITYPLCKPRELTREQKSNLLICNWGVMLGKTSSTFTTLSQTSDEAGMDDDVCCHLTPVQDACSSTLRLMEKSCRAEEAKLL